MTRYAKRTTLHALSVKRSISGQDTVVKLAITGTEDLDETVSDGLRVFS